MAAPTLELLEWVTARIRTYDDVREAWRSNCARTALWDDAVTDGLWFAATDGATQVLQSFGPRVARQL